MKWLEQTRNKLANQVNESWYPTLAEEHSLVFHPIFNFGDKHFLIWIFSKQHILYLFIHHFFTFITDKTVCKHLGTGSFSSRLLLRGRPSLVLSSFLHREHVRILETIKTTVLSDALAIWTIINERTNQHTHRILVTLKT